MHHLDPTLQQVRRLQGTPLFGAISDDTVGFVLSQARVAEIPAGDWILREGERSVAIYWIEQGEVAISRSHRGREVELSRLGAGDVVGEMALFDLGPRSASVCAVKDCRVLEIGTGLLRGLAERDLEQYTIFTMNLARELARRLRRTQDVLLARGEPWQDQSSPPCT